MRLGGTPDEREIKVFLYLRTSTDEQDESPIIQEKRARAFCEEKGWTVDGVYYDIITGKAAIEKRPQFQRMLEDAPLKGVRGFVGLTFNRFLRSTKVKVEMEAELLDRHLFIWGIDDNRGMGLLPSGRPQRASEKAMLNMGTAIDQYYSDFVSDKIRDHHEHRVANRLHHSGSPPFGYKPAKDVYQIDGRWYDGWVPDDTPDATGEGMTIAERLQWIFQRFTETENLMDIAVELTSLGVPTPRLVQWNRLSESEKARRLEIQAKNKAAGHKVMALPPSSVWDSSVLSDTMRSKSYLGMIAYTPDFAQVPGKKREKTWHEGMHEPLITREIFDRVNEILANKHQAKRMPARKKSQSLLTGMLRCTCGMALTLSSKGSGFTQFRYTCNLKKRSRGLACQMPGLNSTLVDPTVLKLLLRGLRVRMKQIRAAAPLVCGQADQGDLALERDQLAKKRARVLENYEEGFYGEGPGAKAERDAKLSPVLRRLEELEKELKPDASPKVDELAQALHNIETLWEEFPLFVKRDILRTYVPDGFHLTGDRRLRAEVCGILLETEIPVNEPTRPGVRYGGRKKQEGQLVLDKPALKLPSLPLSRGESRSGGI